MFFAARLRHAGVQSPPQHSWKNPAERVMSNLNLALQSLCVMRKQTATMGEQLKKLAT